MSSSSSADDVDEEEAAPGGSGKGGAATAACQLTVRRYDHERDAESVRRLWPVALLANCAAYGYPPTLVAEEEEFVRETMTGGDMLDLRAAYQGDAEGRTDFWVAVEAEGGLPVGCVGLREGKEGAGDIGRFAMGAGCRGRGGARMLLAALEAHAAAAGFTAITATTCSANLGAVATFGRCGFEEVYRGRMDGKPEPEWVPFVRFRKELKTGD